MNPDAKLALIICLAILASNACRLVGDWIFRVLLVTAYTIRDARFVLSRSKKAVEWAFFKFVFHYWQYQWKCVGMGLKVCIGDMPAGAPPIDGGSDIPNHYLHN